MKIKTVVLSKSTTGFYFDDQKAIKAGAVVDGFYYPGEPVLPGYRSIRMPGEAVSIQLVLENGMVAKGDCAAVQYSGTDGRDPLFLADEFIPFINEYLKPELLKEDLVSFREIAGKYDQFTINGNRLHTAIRYGLTQSLLHAIALVKGITMAEVIRLEYGIIDEEYERIPIFTQSGDERYSNLDKMIIKGVDVFPHALINNVLKLGSNGENLLNYLLYLRERIFKLRTRDNYYPVIHIDVYGTIGIIFDNDLQKMTDYIITLEKAIAPFKLRVEGPVDSESREDTMLITQALCRALEKAGSFVEIVADEWCNTLEDIKYFADNKAAHMIQIKTPDLGGVNNIAEAIIYCNQKGIGSYCGGTCNETNVSAEVTTNIALACKATQILAKPGMGVDEGFMIVGNEMNRLIALIKERKKR